MSGADDSEIEQALGDVETRVEVDPDAEDGPVVTRTAAFAEVADRPKEKAITGESKKNDVKFFDDLIEFDAELAGTVRAQSQSGASGFSVTHPAIEGEVEDYSDLEREITSDCRELVVNDLRMREEGATVFKQLIAHGNDVNHIQYEEASEADDGEGGVTGLTPLPLRALTILDAETFNNDEIGTSRSPTINGAKNFDDVITSADRYVINEQNDDARDSWPAHDVLHLALDRRANWHKDRLGRWTYGVWGERRLESVRYSLQAKQNTLANKVAIDDKMLTREFYKIDVEALYGHIEDDKVRQEKAEEYADELREKLEGLDADQKPIVPEEVTVEVHGPDGTTARNMADFIQTMNDSLQHALTYHVASFGRDAGGTERGNRPAKEMSDNSVRQLRDVVRTAFRRLFEIHAMMRHEDAREVVNEEFDDIRRYRLADDVTLPVVTFDPVDPQEQADKVRNAISLYEKGVADLNEARAVADLEPVEKDDFDPGDGEGEEEADPDKHFFKLPKTVSTGGEGNAGPGGEGPDSGPDDGPTDEGPGDGPGGDDEEDPSGNRRSFPTDSGDEAREVEPHEPYDTDPEEWDDEG